MSELWISTTRAETALESATGLNGKNEAKPWDFVSTILDSGPQILFVHQNPMEDTDVGFFFICCEHYWLIKKLAWPDMVEQS